MKNADFSIDDFYNLVCFLLFVDKLTYYYFIHKILKMESRIMKSKMMLFVGVSFFIISIIGGMLSNEFPDLKGPYLGQKPPGLIPEVFAPGIISTDATEGSSSFSKDGNIYLFARARADIEGILIMKKKEGIWQKPILAPFSAGKYDWDFMLAPDDKTVFVASGRPLKKGKVPPKDHSIWMSERIDKGWTEPQLLPFPVNSGQHDSYPSVSEEKTLYFFSRRKGGCGQGDIYRSKIADGQYRAVENIGSPINTEYHEVDPFIAPDESYLIFCSDKPGGYGKTDIYITFRNKKGRWSQPVNMGEKINSSFQEYIPNVTPDGKYFFFTTNKTGNRDIYWVDAKIIDALKLEDSNERPIIWR